MGTASNDREQKELKILEIIANGEILK